MKNPVILACFLFLFACQSNVRTERYASNSEETVAAIDSAIAEEDTYKYMGHLRYPTVLFPENEFPVFDSIHFKSSFVVAHYDTLERHITRMAVLSYKDSTSGPVQTDNFYYNNQNELVKINILNHDTDPQNFATYYFQNNKLIYKQQKKIEIEDLNLYLEKVGRIYKKINTQLTIR